MKNTFHDLINELVYYGKSDKRIIDCSEVTEYPNLEEIGIVKDFETIGSA